MNKMIQKFNLNYKDPRAGMEMVQVAILIAIAIAAGLIFKDKIGDFINSVFSGLNQNDFSF